MNQSQSFCEKTMGAEKQCQLVEENENKICRAVNEQFDFKTLT